MTRMTAERRRTASTLVCVCRGGNEAIVKQLLHVPNTTLLLNSTDTTVIHYHIKNLQENLKTVLVSAKAGYAVYSSSLQLKTTVIHSVL